MTLAAMPISKTSRLRAVPAGVLLACAFGIINVMWMESEEMLGKDQD